MPGRCCPGSLPPPSASRRAEGPGPGEPSGPSQSALFHWLLDRRHEREDLTVDAGQLPVVAARQALEAMPLDDRRPFLEAPDAGARLSAAGATWEWLSGWLAGPMDAKAWDAVIPSMGYMALLRNLRNFDDAGVSVGLRERRVEVKGVVAEREGSEEGVVRFRDCAAPMVDELLADGEVVVAVALGPGSILDFGFWILDWLGHRCAAHHRPAYGVLPECRSLAVEHDRIAQARGVDVCLRRAADDAGLGHQEHAVDGQGEPMPTDDQQPGRGADVDPIVESAPIRSSGGGFPASAPAPAPVRAISDSKPGRP